MKIGLLGFGVVTVVGAVVGTVVGAVVGATVVVGVVSAGLLPPQAVRENARTRVSARQMPRVIRFFICINSPFQFICVLTQRGNYSLRKSQLQGILKRLTHYSK